MIAKSSPFFTAAERASAQVEESSGSTQTRIILHDVSVAHSSRKHSACYAGRYPWTRETPGIFYEGRKGRGEGRGSLESLRVVVNF